MTMINEDQWISTDARTKKLVIRFWVKGFPKQFFISTGLKDGKRNREIVRSKRDAIATDIALERFDSTLISYNFSPAGRDNKVQVIEEAKPKYQYNILDLWHKFTDFQETQLEQTTILGRYVYIKKYCNRLPTLSLDEASGIRDWLVKNAGNFTARLILDYFSNCCRWAVDSRLIYDNPFENLTLKKRRTKVTNESDYRAFTLEQRDVIIESFENHDLYSHYTALVKFLFWTGCRPGEAFALSWDDISTDCCKISIDKSCNKYKILKSTKNNRKRIFPTVQGSKLQRLLLSLRAENNSSLIFQSKSGLPMTSDLFKPAWTGYSTKQNGTTYRYMGVVHELATQGLLPYLKPYATRHTFATWAISNKVSPDKVALWIGDSVETVLRFYCHPNVVEADCPDF
ncbi:tyrosine-type recombinase/integrase [Nostoc sp.]|uniref:tyrosine-type recombinase/integrase n=1 Tax=Nostoc sp. TaxID=1180 RepID=UPI002FFAB8EE